MRQRMIGDLVAVDNCLFPPFQPILHAARHEVKSNFYAEPLEEG